ncbi:hypothetical protein OIE66_43205 [Nonomuraea sp. NBC_01738]|uniref:alpha/beta hydrolase n=1 Tax=Nonomuraea sp. NBC_01738 TaxID=2976003 RepID=UPI002E0E5A21|nr:hypothetical protein OIE66_43205 [Nonomuraea sp. NBC_01738]
MRKALGTTALVLSLTACGGAVSEPSAAPAATTPMSTPTPAAVEGQNLSGCFTEQDGKIFKHKGTMGIIAGDGPVGVVISHERRGTVCTWKPLSDRLVAAGFRVLLYNRGSERPEDATVVMAGKLAGERGVKRLFLVGGSIGATTAVPAATRLGKKVAGVVAVSGEVYPDDAAALTAPLFQVGSEHDGYGNAEDMEKTRVAAVKAADSRVLLIPGENAHASALFTRPAGPQVLDAITAFLEKHKG